MKKIVLMGTSLLLVLSLTACGGDSGKDTKDSSKETTTEQAAKSSSKAEESTAASTTESSTTESKAETTGDFVATAADAVFDGTMLKGNSYSVRITDHKVIQPGEKGNEYGEKPVLAFWFDTLVNPDYDNSTPINPNTAWIMNFEAVQDNDPNKVNKLNIAALPDDAFLDDQMAEIKPGGTVASAVAYELNDTETPVKLTATNMLGTEYGSTEFPVK